MKILSINTGYNSSIHNNSVQKPSFKAKLDLGWGVRRSLGESKDKFEKVMEGLQRRLREDPINPKDTLHISSYDGLVGVSTKYGPQKANLEMEIDGKCTQFYYNQQSSVDELVDQLYNGYKHTRYEAHYAPRSCIGEPEGLDERYYSRM